MTKSDEVKALVDAAVQGYGKLDVMVRNAVRTHRNQLALDVSEDDFDKCHANAVPGEQPGRLHRWRVH